MTIRPDHSSFFLPQDSRPCCGDYRPQSGVYDEMAAPDGVIRPHWQTFLQALGALGGDELARRRLEALHFLRENGSTYNLHGDGGRERWTERLDPIPHIISLEDWRLLEQGVAQRARLLDLILQDLYGPGALIKDGLLPPEIVHGHRNFLRPCHRGQGEGEPKLALCAVDVGRDGDGRWRVLRHLAQAPSGVGYALENRTVMARVFPELIGNCKVHRLSHFFRSLRYSLSNFMLGRGRDLHIVILTAGPHTETYFEHAYLAAYLGYPLVLGDDLTVRDAAVWLKSLDGLERVDIILRFLDDALCDPLELAANSRYGVPGLVEAARRGNVFIANPLGSGVLDHLGLESFLPAVCRHLLDEELLIPGPTVLWCGEAKTCEQVLDHLAELDILEVYAGPGGQPLRGSTLSPRALEQWRQRIRAFPFRYAALQPVSLASSPSYERGRLVPRKSILRLFVAASNGQYLVMPGGLAHPEQPFAAGGEGTAPEIGSKDVWVLSTEIQKHVSLWLQPGRIEENLRSSSVLTSRAAENLFWVGRYAERAEGVARLLRTVLQYSYQSSRFDDRSEMDCLHCLLKGLTRVTDTLPGFAAPGSEALLAAPEPELLALVIDLNRPGSLAFTLRAMIRAAYAVRERWSKDTWRVLDRIDEKRRDLAGVSQSAVRSLQQELDHLITSLMAFAGLVMESMIREQGWLLLDIGRRIERALQFVELFRSTLVERHDGDMVREHLVLEAILITTENIIAYRRRYRSYLQLETVLEMLLMDEINPRSLAYQLNRLREHVAELPRDRVGTYRFSEEERCVLEAFSRVRLSDVKVLTAKNDPDHHPHLERVLKKVADLLATAAESISKTYFAHVQESQQLTTAGSELIS